MVYFLADEGGPFDNREGALESSLPTNAGELAAHREVGVLVAQGSSEVHQIAPPRGEGPETLKTE